MGQAQRAHQPVAFDRLQPKTNPPAPDMRPADDFICIQCYALTFAQYALAADPDIADLVAAGAVDQMGNGVVTRLG